MQTTYVEDTPLEGTSHSEIPFVHIVQSMRSVMITERGARVLALEPTRLTWNTAGIILLFSLIQTDRICTAAGSFFWWSCCNGLAALCSDTSLCFCNGPSPLLTKGRSNGEEFQCKCHLKMSTLSIQISNINILLVLNALLKLTKGRSNGIAQWEEFQCQLDRLTNLKPRPMQLRLIF